MGDFYKMDPADWDFGTASLSLEEEAAYLRIINAIHKHRGPVPNVDRVLAGMFRCSTRKARALVSALIDAGKLFIEDGAIWNGRARSDLVRRGFATISAQVRGSKGGRTRAENAAKSLENNDTAQATASTREEKRREDTVETNVSTGAAAPPDPAKLMFDSGVMLLTAAGLSASNARALIGKWRKDNGTEAVIAAIGRAQREGAVDPVAFIVGALRFAAKAAEPKPGDCRVLGNGQKQVFQAGNGWMTEHA